MRRRSRAGGKSPNAQAPTAVARKSRIATKAGHRRSSSAASLRQQVALLTRERDEALQQQTATADVLQIISRSTFDLQSVLNTLVESAARLCEADIALIVRPQGSNLEVLANYRMSQASIDVLTSTPIAGGRWTLSGRVLAEGRTVNIPDWRADPGYTFSAVQEISGLQSGLGVPLMREGLPVGVMNLWRTQVRPFSDKQIELVTTFANQAVIAIENARLLAELRESLQQQTATADVLKVISRSTFDLQSVLDTLVESAARLCDADSAGINRPQGDNYTYVASYGFSPEFEEFMRAHPIVPGHGTVVGRVVMERRAIHVQDTQNDPQYTFTEAARIGGFRTLLGVPLLREGIPIGVIVLTRKLARPFNDKQIELAQTFADQAVIAIENTRLFEAEQQRTRELSESLEQQTATSEVLQIISSSPGDLEPVFASMLENAVRICDAKFGNIYRWDGDALMLVATYNTPAALAEARKRSPLLRFGSKNPVGRMINTKTTVHVVDAAVSEAYIERDPATVAAVELGGLRTFLAVPMLKENELIGAFALSRQEVRPFTDKQIALVTSFAAQAVIAIENTRLLNELRESLQQQTATSEVLKVISRSTFDLQTVLKTLVESAVTLCEANIGHIARPGPGGFFQSQANFGFSKELKEELERSPFRPGRESVIARALLERATVHILDAQTDPEYTLTKAQKLGGYRSMIGVPLLREGAPIGVFGLARNSVRAFTERQIELLATFADQAVIAIENARLLNELAYELRLQQQTATAEVLKVISRSTFDLQAVFATLVESAARLCRADKATIMRLKDKQLPVVATYGLSDDFKEYIRAHPPRLDRSSVSGRTLLEGRTVQVTDVMSDPEYQFKEAAHVGGWRTGLGVPLMREDTPIGVLFVTRDRVEPFNQQQIELITTFADQAVIAIENTRLFDEVQARTQELAQSVEELRALGEVSQAVNSTLDLQTVLSTIVAKAVQLSGTEAGAIYVFDELAARVSPARHVRHGSGVD